jgi:hypothetical protein
MRSSARLTCAVAAERSELERERTRLLREASELRAALAQIELGWRRSTSAARSWTASPRHEPRRSASPTARAP